MPTIEAEKCTPIQVYSLGGSTLFPPEHPHLYIDFFNNLRKFLEHQIKLEHTIIAFIGGGQIARDRQKAARDVGITDRKLIDRIGIDITRHNALFIKNLFSDLGLISKVYNYQTVKPGIIYLRGGTEPGHTTDYAAVETAIKERVPFVFNISNTPGFHPYYPDGTFDKTRIVPEMTYDEILPFLEEHTPGHNAPIDKPAAVLARDNEIIYVTMGTDMDNLTACLCGDEFTGTIIHP